MVHYINGTKDIQAPGHRNQIVCHLILKMSQEQNKMIQNIILEFIPLLDHITHGVGVLCPLIFACQSVLSS